MGRGFQENMKKPCILCGKTIIALTENKKYCGGCIDKKVYGRVKEWRKNNADPDAVKLISRNGRLHIYKNGKRLA